MEILVYITRAVFMLLVTWLGLRIIGKKSIAQMTSYEIAGLLLLTTVAAEPLVYKIPSKATVGVLTLAFMTVIIGLLSLNKKFYNFDMKPSIVVANGKVDRDELKRNKMNITFLMSLIRSKGYASIAEVEFAIFEPNGQLSVFPKSQERPVKPKDLQINTQYEGLALPLIIEGEIVAKNLQYAKLDENWLQQELKKARVNSKDVFIAELDTQGKLYLDLYHNKGNNAGGTPPVI